MAKTKKSGGGNMVLRFQADDALTGKALAAGTRVFGAKLGGEWSFTAEVAELDLRTFRKLISAMLYSLGPDEGGPEGLLDSADYALLEEFGNRYEYFARQIGCSVPGLKNWPA